MGWADNTPKKGLKNMYAGVLEMDDRIITDMDIQALVDNQLDWEEEKRVRRHLFQSPDAQRRYEDLRNQKQLLQLWWQGRKHH